MIESEYISVSGIDELPIIILNKALNPDLGDFSLNNTEKPVPAMLKNSAFQIPLNPYSEENLRALKVILDCSNTRIYDNFIIRYFIDYNWHAIYSWAFVYSLLLVFQLISFLLVIAFGSDNLINIIIFSIIYLLTFSWEVLQMACTLGIFIRLLELD